MISHSQQRLLFEYRRNKLGASPGTLLEKEGNTTNQKRRIHDGIAGAVLTLGTWLSYAVDPTWLLVPGILGITLVQSAFTGFCPVYYILDKTCPFEPTETLADSTRT